MGAIGGEYEDKKQAYAICMDKWRESKKKSQPTFIIKSDKRFIIGGYANVYMLDEKGSPVPDRQNEVVTLEALDDALKVMMAKESRRNHMFWHTNMQIGEIIWEATDSDGTLWKTHVVYEPDEQYPKKGLFILAEPFKDNPLSLEAKTQMEQGKLLEFSIGGLPLVTERKCDEEKCWTEISKLYLGETSSCENAINVESKAFVLKAEQTDAIGDMETRLEKVEKTLLLKAIDKRLTALEKTLQT